MLHTDHDGLGARPASTPAPAPSAGPPADGAAARPARHGGELGDTGPAVAVESARRLACDCRLEHVVDGPDGEPVGIGRARRNVPAWLVRQLRRRSPCCEFPGCTRTRLLHAHHERHWVDGGPTDYRNLILACKLHHWLVHEGGWRLVRRADGVVEAYDPDGNLVRRPVFDEVGAITARLAELLPQAS